MATVTLSSKSQITLPAEIVRALGLHPGDKLVAELIGDHVVLLPQPKSWAEYLLGSMKGFWGTEEEIDRYLAQERHSLERAEWRQEFDDFMATDENVSRVVGVLRSFDRCLAPLNALMRDARIEGSLNSRQVEEALQKLVQHGAVRKIPANDTIIEKFGGVKQVYFLVRDFAQG